MPTMGPPSQRPSSDTAPGVSVAPPVLLPPASGRRWGWVLGGAVVSAGVMLGVGGYALVGPSSPSPDLPPAALARPLPVPAPPPEPARPRVVPVVPPMAPVNASIQLRTSVTERGRVLRGRTGDELVGEINPQPLVLPRPRGAAQTYRIEVEGYEPAVVDLHENDPAVVLVPLSESVRRHRPHANDHSDNGPHGHQAPAAPGPTPNPTPNPPAPSHHSDGLRDPWN